jgi:hypothetical protein
MQNEISGIFGAGYDFLDRGRDLVASGVDSVTGAFDDFIGLDFFGERDPNAYSGNGQSNTGRANDMEITTVDRINPTNINGMLQGEVFGIPVKYIAGGLGALVVLVVLKKAL